MTIKTAFLTFLFNDTFYVMDSEPALERTYADLTMISRPEMRRFQLLDILLEFEFVKLSDLAQSGVTLRQMEASALLALDAVQEKINEAKPQLQRYRKTLVKNMATTSACIPMLSWQSALNGWSGLKFPKRFRG